MSVTDPIADLLTRIRNAYLVRHRAVDVPASRLKLEVLRVLQEEGYINGFQPVEGAARPTTRIFLRYHRQQPVVHEIRRVSTPGLRRYLKSDAIGKVRGGLGIAIISTSQGIMTDRLARRKRVGGEVIAEVW
jgi:small subunit ribosomal protein S8